MKKKIFSIALFICSFLSFSAYAADYNKFFSKPIVKNEVRFIFHGSSGVIIHTYKGTIIIDPATYLKENDLVQLRKGGLGLVLFTHEHYDHYALAGVRKIVERIDTPIIAEAKVAKHIKEKIPKAKIFTGKPGKIYKFGDITVKTIEGIHTVPIILFQIKMDNITIFHGGDSGYVPLKKYRSDIAFIPTGAPSPTCSPEKAFKMAKDIKPEIAVAMHGNDYEHKDFEKRIKERMPGMKIIIPEKGKVIVLKIGE